MFKKFAALGLALTMALSFASSAMAAVKITGTEDVLTVEAAAKKAIQKDSSIKKSEETEKLSDDRIDSALDALYASTNDSAMLKAEVNLMNLELSRSLNIKNIKAQKENVEYSITKYFNTIINAENNLKVFDEALNIQKRDLEISELKLKLGMLSQVEYDEQALKYEKAVNARLVYVHNIDKAYRDLNNAMGEDLDKKYKLQLNLEYKPIDEVNLTQYANNFVDKSLMVEQVENLKATAKYSLDNYKDPYNPVTGEIYESYNQIEELTASFNQASRSLEDTKVAVKKMVINTYNGLRDMEVDIKAKELDIENAYKQLEVMEKRLELGQITALDVDKLKYDIMDKEEKLRQAKNTYVLSAMAFANPNILTGSASSGQGGGSDDGDGGEEEGGN